MPLGNTEMQEVEAHLWPANLQNYKWLYRSKYSRNFYREKNWTEGYEHKKLLAIETGITEASYICYLS